MMHRDKIRQVWRRNGRFHITFTLLIIFLWAALALVACDQPVMVDVVVTEVVTVEGFEEVVTRIARQTATPTPVIIDVRRPVVLDVGKLGGYPSIDPQKSTDDNALDLMESLFAGLTNFNHQTTTVEPELAQGWEVTRDGRVWTFYLRDDIFWVRPPARVMLDNEVLQEVTVVRPVVAADVVTAVQRACQSATGAPDAFILFIISGCEQVYSLREPAPGDLEAIGVKAIDDRTVQFTLTKPAGYFLTMTTLDLFRPVPSELIEEFEDEWQAPANIYTSGPYVLTSGDLSKRRTVMHRNPRWPLPRGGNAEMVNIFFFEDSRSMYEMWVDKELDIAPLPPDIRPEFLLQYRPRALMVTNQTVFYMGFNMESGVFREPNVRRAFSAAINREELAAELYGSRATGLRHLAPPGVVGAPPLDMVGVGYNPGYARQQMADSGFGSCRLMPPITIMVSSLDLSLLQAELIRDMWVRELECTQEQIIIEQVQFGTLLANTRRDAGAARPDVWELGWSSYYPDSHNWLYELLHCTDSENRMARSCTNLDEAMRLAAQATDPAERVALYRQVENGFFGEGAESPMVPLYVRGVYFMQQNWIAFVPAHFGGEQYNTYLIDPDLKRLERSR
jgi:oligopeptide transport system substrate-binding protein